MSHATRRPNILFLFADQMRGMDMRCAGNADMVTPSLDRMADEGVLCERHYATCPLCSPNRATMLTGTYPTTHRLIFNDNPMRTDLPSLGTVARRHGYRTGYIGKWHIDGGPRDRFIPPGPRRLGFDDFWAVANCRHEYFDAQFHRDTPETIRVPGYEPEVQTDLACEFLDSHRTDDPFCLVVAWGPPHNPYEQVPDKYRDMYDADAIALRPNCGPIPRKVLDPAWSHRPTTRDYYAQITSLDEMVGRLLAQLGSMGVADDTIVLFSSDHGDMMWSQGLLYKCVPFEECVNIPLVIRYPNGLPAGRRCASLIESTDLLPSLCALAGWDIPQSVAGVDCSGAMRGEDGAPQRDSAFLAQYCSYVFRPDSPTPVWRGLRTARHTYAEAQGAGPWVLYDNEADPYQMRNLADDPAQGGMLHEQSTRLHQRLDELGDPFLPGPQMGQRFGLPDHREPA